MCTRASPLGPSCGCVVCTTLDDSRSTAPIGTGRRKVIWSRDRKRSGFEENIAALVKHSSLERLALKVGSLMVRPTKPAMSALLWTRSGTYHTHKDPTKDLPMQITILWEHQLHRLDLRISARRTCENEE
jgi:hypothetical protein